MEFKTYIQQIKFNGLSYSQGTLVDLLQSFHIICKEFPFKRNPETKDLATRDWVGTDGTDVYVPEGSLPIKSYEVDATFLYKRNVSEGTAQTGETPEAKRNRLMRTDINDFLDFICGRKKGGGSDSVQSGRLAIYNEYLAMGRKDVVVKSVSNEVYFVNDDDPDAVATFKVKFSVYDPTTNVSYSTTGGTPTLIWT